MTKDNRGGARPGSGRKPGNIKRKPYSFRLSPQEHLQVKNFIKKLKEEIKMTTLKTWERDTYTVSMVDYDHDLKAFEVVQGDTVQTIYPATIEDMQDIIADLDNGDDVNGWEDGMGNTISLEPLGNL